jgi:hypothetical protein
VIISASLLDAFIGVAVFVGTWTNAASFAVHG